MPSYDPDLLDALEDCVVGRVSGTVWRQVLAPSSVTRSNLRGGRWNPSGVETLYCSLDPLTAAFEIDNLLAAQPVPIKRQRLTYPVRTQLSRVADLRPHPWGSAFAYEFDLDDAEQCQMIGAAASWLGCGALVIPSLARTETTWRSSSPTSPPATFSSRMSHTTTRPALPSA